MTSFVLTVASGEVQNIVGIHPTRIIDYSGDEQEGMTSYQAFRNLTTKKSTEVFGNILDSY